MGSYSSLTAEIAGSIRRNASKILFIIDGSPWWYGTLVPIVRLTRNGGRGDRPG